MSEVSQPIPDLGPTRTNLRLLLLSQVGGSRLAAVLLLPALFVLSILFVIPIGHLLSMSAHAPAGYAQVSSSYTLENYWSFISDPFYLGILLDTLLLGL